MDYTEVINLLCEKFGIAVDWAGENLTPYLQTIVQEITIGRTKMVATGLWISVAVVVIGIALTIIDWDECRLDGAGKGFGIAFIIIGLILIGVLAVVLVKWKYMPTYMTAQYIKSLVK